jgi:pimeloyl-ACP methyl ester carboxylesterase
MVDSPLTAIYDIKTHVNVERLTVCSEGAQITGLRFGKGPPLLLAHPAVFSKAYFAAAAEVWGERFECVAVDQRGHGETESDGPIEPSAMAEDLRAVLDRLGWERAAVGGTSLGAATTLVLALRHPGRVSALVQDLPAFAPGSSRNPKKTERMAEAFGRGDFEEAVRRTTEGMSAPRADAWAGALRSDWKHYDAARLGPKLARAMRSTAGWRIVERWPGDLAGLAVPVRILAVEGDPVHPIEAARVMARTIPDARLVPRVPSLSPAAIARQWIEVLGT